MEERWECTMGVCSRKSNKKNTKTKIIHRPWPNSPAPLTDDWKVTDDSSVNFHDVFFFIFCQIIAKNEENTSWKFTDESSVTFQLSISGPGEFGLYL